MFRILVVDDEEKIREVIRTYAEYDGHTVVEAKDGFEAVEKCKQEDFDVIVMDIMMPRLDGFSAYKEIKKHKDIPVLMLSARGEEYDKLFGFEIGIDDYVVKPFSPKELMARLNVIVTRHMPMTEHHELIRGDIRVDLDGRDLFVDGKKTDPTPKEFDLLVFLMRHESIALSREQLLDGVWGIDFFGEDRTVDTHIKMLRNTLGCHRDYIVTVRGIGYKFQCPEA